MLDGPKAAVLAEAAVAWVMLNPQPLPPRAGYAGARRRVLVVDNEADDRGLLDLRLQDMPGDEVFRALEADAPAFAAIAFTAG